MLPYIERCQTLANRLPREAVLIVLPAGNTVSKQTLLIATRLLAREGHQVRVVPAADVTPS